MAMPMHGVVPAGVGRLITGGTQVADATLELVRSRPGDLTMEIRRLTDPQMIDALVARAERSGQDERMLLLVDPHHYDFDAIDRLDMPRLANGGHPWTAEPDRATFERLRGLGVGIELYGNGFRPASGDALWAHGKATAVRDASRAVALLKTGTEDVASRGKHEAGYLFEGDLARRIGRLTDLSAAAGHTLDRAQLRREIDAASGVGILVREPLTQQNVIVDRLRAELLRPHGDGARLSVSSGRLFAPELTEDVARAARSGTDVRVRVRNLGEQDEAILRDARIPYSVLVDQMWSVDAAERVGAWRARGANVVVQTPEAFRPEVEQAIERLGIPRSREPYPHFNFVGLERRDGAEQAYLGSLELSVEYLDHGGRDLGVMLAGSAARDARTALMPG